MTNAGQQAGLNAKIMRGRGLLALAASAVCAAGATGQIQIGSATDLDTVVRLLSSGQTFELIADIDLTGWNWIPIGTNASPWNGTFDGNGYTISGLTITGPTAIDNDDRVNLEPQGLFGVTANAVFIDVDLEADSVTSDAIAGMLVGKMLGGSATGCSVSGDIDGGPGTGALAGVVDDVTITGCSALNVEVTAARSGGALIGMVHQSSIVDCGATGSVAGQSQIGGLIGFAGDSDLIGSTAKVDVDYLDDPVCPAAIPPLWGATPPCVAKWHGGFIGHIHPHPYPGPPAVTGLPAGDGSLIRQCNARGEVIGELSVGGFVGNLHGTLVEDCFATGDVTALTASVGGFAGYLQAESGIPTVVRDSWARGYSTTEDSGGGFFVFLGAFGANLTDPVGAPGEGGFAAYMEGLVEGDPAEPLVVIERCRAFGDVNERGVLVASDSAGGFLGFTEPGSVIRDSIATGDVFGISTSGGFVGWSEGLVENCSAHGDVAASAFVGGFVGQMQDILASAINSDNGDENAEFSSVIKGSRAYGNVDAFGNTTSTLTRAGHLTSTGAAFAGYLFPNTTLLDNTAHGILYAAGEWAGGMVGHMSEGCLVERCASFGPIFASDGHTGGLVGAFRDVAGDAPQTIRDSYSQSDIIYEGPSDPAFMEQVGGLVGGRRSGATGEIIDSFASGLVEPMGSMAGGLVGYLPGTMLTDSFWDIEATGQPSSTLGTGLTTSQMRLMSSYPWDFVGTWDIIDTETYPFLR